MWPCAGPASGKVENGTRSKLDAAGLGEEADVCLTNSYGVATLVQHVHGYIVVVDASGLRVDAGEAIVLPALPVGCVFTRAGAAVAPVVVALGLVLWEKGMQ